MFSLIQEAGNFSSDPPRVFTHSSLVHAFNRKFSIVNSGISQLLSWLASESFTLTLVFTYVGGFLFQNVFITQKTDLWESLFSCLYKRALTQIVQVISAVL